MSRAQPVLAACIGNELAGDDAFGPLVAAELRRLAPAGLEAVDLAIKPYALLDHIAGRRMLIIVDAADWPGAAAGDLLQCEWDSPDRPQALVQRAASTHGVSVPEQIELARQLGMLPPRVVLIAVSAREMRMGTGPSEPVRLAAAEAVKRIVALVHEFARVC